MLILLSPAKKLKFDNQLKGIDFSEPLFISEAEKLMTKLKKIKAAELKKLMKVSDAIADLNINRYAKWNVSHQLGACKQAAFAFNGEVYAGLNITGFSSEELSVAQNEIRILSGLYGVLKPLDLIYPYRLEMGTQLKINKYKNLYEFWGDKIVKEINKGLEDSETNLLVNLASNEYFKAINQKQLEANVVTPSFKDFKNGAYKTIMVYAKKARGEMAAYIVKNNIKSIEELKMYNVNGYMYNDRLSKNKQLVFTRE